MIWRPLRKYEKDDFKEETYLQIFSSTHEILYNCYIVFRNFLEISPKFYQISIEIYRTCFQKLYHISSKFLNSFVKIFQKIF